MGKEEDGVPGGVLPQQRRQHRGAGRHHHLLTIACLSLGLHYIAEHGKSRCILRT